MMIYTTLAGDAVTETAYTTKVKGYSPFAYWVLNETSGSTATEEIDSPNQDGTYTGVTLNSSTGPDGDPVGLWDGTNDVAGIYTATLDGNFDGTEGTLAGWFKVSGAGVWSDGIGRYFVNLTVDASNNIRCYKWSTVNKLRCEYRAGGTLERNELTVSSTGWVHYACTWSVTDDKFITYIDGTQTGSINTSIGSFVGSFNSDEVAIGSFFIASPGNVWDGYCAHVALWDSPLSAANILDLATV